ncbi:thiamine phosphate synthase [Veillonella sp. oral taxon 780]|uniref:thiamine phosphate synthase n=1 Tax=Veillonella sp. oral taxon 780 TaxID=671229 RepID=UPI00056DB3D7|nr:thiamine phosphate synthase [Veillonella sp. oral taxon 780]
MKKNNQSIDTLVLITNRQLLKDDISLATYGVALSRGIERIQKYGKHCINHTEESSLPYNIRRAYRSTVKANLHSTRLPKQRADSAEPDNWMRNHSSLYTLCRDTDLPFEEYLQLCDAIGDTVVHHGKVITNREQLGVVLATAKRIHLPTNLIRYWQSEQEELWITLQQCFQDITMWSTVHNQDDIKLLASLGIPNLEYVLISPIFPTPCKTGHPGIGVSRGEILLQQMQNHYRYVKGIALGGIHEYNYQQCLQYSFTGVAIMSDFMKRVHSNIDT